MHLAPPRHWFAALYAGALIALFAGAVAHWRLPCEGFGCTGAGIAWMAWAVFYGLVLLLGASIRALAGSATATRRWLQASLAGASGPGRGAARVVAAAHLTAAPLNLR